MGLPCNLCGLPCALAEGCPADGDHGLIDACVTGGYISTPGNGQGALDDLVEYRFSLCEFCLDHLFQQFAVAPLVTHYSKEGDTIPAEPFIAAADRVSHDEWRKDKTTLASQQHDRAAARIENRGRFAPVVEFATTTDPKLMPLGEGWQHMQTDCFVLWNHPKGFPLKARCEEKHLQLGDGAHIVVWWYRHVGLVPPMSAPAENLDGT